MCIVVDEVIPKELDAVVWRYVFRRIIDNKAEGSFLEDYIRQENEQGGAPFYPRRKGYPRLSLLNVPVIAADTVTGLASDAGPSTSSIRLLPLTASTRDDIELAHELVKPSTSQFNVVRAWAEKVKDELGTIRSLLERFCTRLTRPTMQQMERLRGGITATRYV